MTIDHHQGHLESVRSFLSTLVYPLQYVVNMPLQAGKLVSRSVVTQQMLLEENSDLREELLLLSSSGGDGR